MMRLVIEQVREHLRKRLTLRRTVQRLVVPNVLERRCEERAGRCTARPRAENRPFRHRGRLGFDPRRRFCVGHVSSAQGVSRETRRGLALELPDELGVVVAVNGRLVLSPPEVWFSGLYGHVGGWFRAYNAVDGAPGWRIVSSLATRGSVP